ncbi:hypothetical protein NDU88_004196 [Pleurodeles waltl]|uniref:Uncharacterized protein n=1 Tax=Pleurodeles waltl TaxID=8319 RepID=A0AAV7KX01_PLEWA|nr:hypothetical protein NDU88_004196 [Pleurodeles waltl]
MCRLASCLEASSAREVSTGEHTVSLSFKALKSLGDQITLRAVQLDRCTLVLDVSSTHEGYPEERAYDIRIDRA